MSDLTPAALESHGIRATFEKCAFGLFIAVIGIMCVAGLVGIFSHPAAKDAVDWGQSMVNRVVQLKDTILDLLGALFVGTTGTQIRGHLDERLTKN